MAISFPLAAKSFTGLAAIGAPVATGIYYKNEIADILFSKSQSEQINEKLKELGITENKCKFSDSDTSKECELNKDELDKLKFISDSSSSSTESSSESNSIKLKIEIVTDKEEEKIFGDLKFSFPDITKTIKIGKSGNQTTLKKGSKPEFKQEGNKLKRAWTIEKLSEKIGLKCPKEIGSDRCILETGKKINFKREDKKVTDATFKLHGELAFEKDQEGYNQGFKFTIGSEFDITLSKDGSIIPDPDKIEKTNSSYEIIEYENIWYLSKVKR